MFLLTCLSFDSLIAMLGGRLEIPVNTCLETYITMSEKIFGPAGRKHKLGHIAGYTTNKYRSKNFVSVLEAAVGDEKNLYTHNDPIAYVAVRQ
jgi:hypothetical protein